MAGLVALGVLLGASTAEAEVTGPTAVCATSDPRLAELSGLATDGGDRRWAVSDSGSRVRVYELAQDCSVSRVLTGAVDPRDVEDLARAPDGTFWLADTGDNEHARATVALIELSPAGVAEVHRMRYVDGPHDAEALLMDRAGVPLIVTKEPFAPAGIYRPERPLTGPGRSPEAPVALSRVGQVVLPRSETVGGPVAGVGTRTITGGTTSRDGTVAALRTYTDAWLYAVPDGDLLAALQSAPVQIPLPGEPQGEAIAFDGRGTLLSGSETRFGVVGRLRTVTGAATSASNTDTGDAGAGEPQRTEPDPAGGPSSGVLFGGAAALIGVAAVVMVAGVLASRRRSRSRWR